MFGHWGKMLPTKPPRLTELARASSSAKLIRPERSLEKLGDAHGKISEFLQMGGDCSSTSGAFFSCRPSFFLAHYFPADATGSKMPRVSPKLRPMSQTVRQSESPANSHTAPDYCPPAAGPDVFTPAEKTEHIVILSWKASATDPSTLMLLDIASIAACRASASRFSRINIHPVPKTACTDDLVENGKKYDYKVVAISKRQIMSRPSNVAHAEIPKNKPRKHTEEAPPLCREAESG